MRQNAPHSIRLQHNTAQNTPIEEKPGMPLPSPANDPVDAIP